MLGASGGVGTGCVLLAKMLGAPKWSPAHRAPTRYRRLKDPRRRYVINYKETDFSKWVIEKYGKPQRRSYAKVVPMSSSLHPAATPGRPTLRCVKRGGQDPLVCGATAATIRRKTCVTSGASS